MEWQSLRQHAPLLDAWHRFHDAKPPTPYTIPGHKYREDLIGPIVRDDLPLFGALASIKDAPALLARAEALAAQAWGVDWAAMSVAGSTHANQALALAVGSPGDRVIVGRTLHRSLLSGLVIAGLEPVWIYPDLDPELGVPLGYSAEEVQRALRLAPDARAVMIGNPSYVGTYGDVASVADVAHAAGIPLIVDAAWAAYFGFHPDLPDHALALGADAMVTSAHKTLPTWSQGALVLARTKLLDRDRLQAGFEVSNTTSPSGTILASIDGSRALLELHGEELLTPVIAATAELKTRLAGVEGLHVLSGPGVDPLKVCVMLGGSGADGNEIERAMIARGFPMEMADRDTLLPIVSLADTADSLGALGECIADLVETHRGEPRPLAAAAAWGLRHSSAVTPTEAFFAPRQRVALEDSIGRVSAELIAPYPPGVPVLAPGDRIDAEAIAALAQARRSGVRIAYAADPSLREIDVIG